MQNSVNITHYLYLYYAPGEGSEGDYISVRIIMPLPLDESCNVKQYPTLLVN